MGSRFFQIFLVVSGISLFSTEAKSEAGCRPLDSRLQIGANYTYARITPSGQVSSTGNLGGAQALYEFRASNRVYGGLAFGWRQGDTEGAEGHRSLLIFDVEERIGGCLNALHKKLTFVLFTGFGYRHYGEKVSGSSSSVRFNYNEFYIPVGCLFNGEVSPCFAIGLNAQWMPQVYPTVTIIPLTGARWIITDKLANFRVEVPFTATFSSCRHRFSLIFQPFFEYWQDGHTTATTESGTSLNVPGNTYLFAGADLNLRYSF